MLDTLSAVIVREHVRSVQMGVPNAQKTDGSELRNTLEGKEHGKGTESAEQSEEKGRDAEHIS